MIDPTEKDIGRGVVFKRPFCETESGVITSFNEMVVFVRYGSDRNSKATYREDLYFEKAVK